VLGSDPLQDKGGLVVNGLETPHTHGIGAVGTRRPKAQAVRLDELGDNLRIPAKEIAHSDLMSIKIEASFRWTVIC
jgi:hypothetical protein